jgi:zona occludens toxin (predicted ATPase)
MIEMYTGFVGSGKSYHAVRRGTIIADAPAGSRWVIANFPIKKKPTLRSRLPWVGKNFKKQVSDKVPRWIFRDNEDLTVDYLIEQSHKLGFYGKESQCLLLIDEAGILFNSRDWNVKPDERKAWIKFLSQSRKFGYDVVFIVQDARMLDRQIRSLAEYEVQHKKMNNWALFKLFPTTVFACVKFWNGMKGVRGTLEMCVYSKGVADRYDTMALFETKK